MRAMRTWIMKLAALALLVVLPVTLAGWSRAAAEMISTDEVIAGLDADAERARVLDLLAREDVQRELVAMGVDPAEAVQRVDSLSDAEVQRLADRIDTAPAGRIGVVSAIVLVFLVLLITDIAGLTDVYPFVRR